MAHTMKVVAGLACLLLNVHLSLSCVGEGQVLFCQTIPPGAVLPGYSTLLMSVKDAGEINSTVFSDDGLSSVSRLRINNAGVTGITEGAFGSLQNLTSLNLSQNSLTEINPNWFGRPDVLRELSLSENHVEVVDGSSLKGLVGLTRLSLRNNRVRAVGLNSFSSQSTLAELDLSGNRMTRISPQVFGSLRSTRIRLDGNPWDCSCGAEGFVRFLDDLRSRSLLDLPLQVTCHRPPSLRGHPVWGVSACVTSPPPVPHKTTTSSSATYVTFPPSSPSSSLSSPWPSPATEISLHPKPSSQPITTPPPTGMTEFSATPRPPLDANIVCTLVAVIAMLSSLLLVLALLLVLHRRKRSNKTVTPGSPKEGVSRSSRAESPGRSDQGDLPENSHRDWEMGWERSFDGVRAKSANAVLLTSDFCAPVKDQVTSQSDTEHQAKDAETRVEGSQRPRGDTEADGGSEAGNGRNATDAEQAADGRNRDKDPRCVPVSDGAPYLSIGTNLNKSTPDDPNKQSADGPGQRSQLGKVMPRISTWPLTALQWQAKCRTKEDDSCVPDVSNRVEHPSLFHLDTKEKAIGENQPEDLLKMNVAHTKLGNKAEEQLKTEDLMQGSATLRQTDGEDRSQERRGQNRDPKPTDGNEGSDGAEQRNDAKRAAPSRQRKENGGSGSKAPSGGASPDDETLLAGNEYAFMDLLHEVAQNNGRWTRERWKQIHASKPRR